MPSKGLDYYFVNESSFTLSADAKNADDSYTMGPLQLSAGSAFTTGHAEINSDLPFHLRGSAGWSTNTPTSHAASVEINAVTGNASNLVGDMCDMLNTPSIIGSSYALSYGFYDAGSGNGTGLTNHDRLYAYLTPPKQGWMGQLVQATPAVGAAPFSSFVLPGAHDAGTFDLTPVQQLTEGAALAALIATLQLWVPGVSIVGVLQAQRVVTGLAVTQKDNITTMLNLGCRYFDFRPGKAPKPLQPFLTDIYHLHNVIPGYPFKSFLVDVLTWLAANPTEIVVIALSDAGYNDDLRPSAEKLQAIYADAAATVGGTAIGVGGATELRNGLTYNQLLESNTRLLFLNKAVMGWMPASGYDSYSDGAYATAQPQGIITALQGMNAAGQANTDHTVFQLQGTATNQHTAEIVVSLIASLSNATSPLMSTKAYFDATIYPQLPTIYTSDGLSATNLLVLLNDFVDNKLATVAASLTKLRAGG